MYRNPLCDRCGDPINYELEAQDTAPIFEFRVFDGDGAPVGFDLHKKCAREVKKEWDRLIKRGVTNPGIGE